MTCRRAAVAAMGLALTASLGAQSPAGDEAPDPLARAALAALDYSLETWNSRDPTRWASSLHFPHVRPGPGAFELSETPAQYASRVDFNQHARHRLASFGVRARTASIWRSHTAGWSAAEKRCRRTTRCSSP